MGDLGDEMHPSTLAGCWGESFRGWAVLSKNLKSMARKGSVKGEGLRARVRAGILGRISIREVKGQRKKGGHFHAMSSLLSPLGSNEKSGRPPPLMPPSAPRLAAER